MMQPPQQATTIFTIRAKITSANLLCTHGSDDFADSVYNFVDFFVRKLRPDPREAASSIFAGGD